MTRFPIGARVLLVQQVRRGTWYHSDEDDEAKHPTLHFSVGRTGAVTNHEYDGMGKGKRAIVWFDGTPYWQRVVVGDDEMAPAPEGIATWT